jgi:hypothetical protein
VEIPPSTSTHIYLRSKAAVAASASAASTSQEDNDWLSAELRDGHTKIPNLELQEDGSLSAAALPKVLIPVVFAVCFLDWNKKG